MVLPYISYGNSVERHSLMSRNSEKYIKLLVSQEGNLKVAFFSLNLIIKKA